MNANLKLKEYLARRPVRRIHEKGRVLSAVLLPLFIKDDRQYLLFTRRSQQVRYHKGEISFPGGGFDEKDGSLLDTAMRESYEEIGLKPGDVEILGELDDIPTRFSNYIISPFVGSIKEDYDFKTSRFEIDEIIIIPVRALMEKGTCRVEPEFFENGVPYHPHVYYYQDKRITGATAAILKQFLEIYREVLG
ncbi:MAG: CoA pyrophosphatase [Dehalococcoidales bacterium]|nr:CoA pyrophosphatase [Dehalococcoidales bacterium]